MEVLQQAVISYCKLAVSKPDPCATISDLYEQISGSQLSSSLLRTGSPQEQLQVTHWVRYSVLHLRRTTEPLEAALAHATYLVGSSLSLADLAVWSQLSCCPRWQAALKAGSAPKAVERHYNLLTNQLGASIGVLKAPAGGAASGPTQQSAPGASVQFEEGGRFHELTGAEYGKVVVRFPPEASGYLHIGHAKAALLNKHYRDTYGGRLIMRFDDTNPAKETAEFEQVILEDVAALGITYDQFSHTSDHFDRLLQLCERMIRDGKAYVDDTEPEAMKAEREKRIESKNRSNSIEQNIRLWQDMQAGTELGHRCCVRAKIDMKLDNGCMRDPTIYRCKDEPHLRTGNKYKVYPTYDFACPIVDSLEGVTHALRTLEYKDRDAQYYWFIEALGLRKPHLEEFSRLALQNTVLSKRKLTWFVNEGLVDGWDDPRFPTVRGILRRGMTLDGLRAFILAQGFAKSSATMEWDKIWAFNKKVIDPVAPRYTALLKKEAVLVKVTNFDRPEPYSTQVALHPKNPDAGSKTQWHWRELLIDGADAETLQVGELVTFINWGNLAVSRIHRGSDGRVSELEAELRLDNTDYRKTQKVTWLSKLPDKLVAAVCVQYDHIISKPLVTKDEDFKNYVNKNSKRQELMLCEAGLAALRKGDIIQLQRRGFFICDQAAGTSAYSGADMPCYLVAVPDGHQKEMPTSGSRHKGAPAAAAAASSAPAAATSSKGGRAGKGGSAGKEVSKSPSPAPPVAAAVPPPAASAGSQGGLLRQIQAQGTRVRDIKADKKADKAAVQAEVNKLLQLKTEYKSLTGQDWKADLLEKAEATATAPATAPAVEPAAPAAGSTKPGGGHQGLHEFKPLLEKIGAQGELVRDLKAKKADQGAIKSALDQLLALKAEFKAKSGVEHKPELLKQLEATAPASGATAAAAPSATALAGPAATGTASKTADPGLELLRQIQVQGNRVRDIKADKKADKAAVQAEVNKLLQLKTEYKSLTGQEWKADLLQKAEASSAAPAASAPAAPAPATPAPAASAVPAAAAGAASQSGGLRDFKPLLEKIAAQGDLVRDLKVKKADKATVKSAVDQLLALKAEFKAKSGLEHKPELLQQLEAAATSQSTAAAAAQADPARELLLKIKEAGDKVRALKDSGASKPDLEAALNVLMQFKTQFKQVTGKDYKPDMLKSL